MSQRISEQWEALYPLVVKAIRKIAGEINAAGGGTIAHGLSSALHTGTLADSQAPQFLLTSGARALTGNLGVGAGITIDGVDIDQFKLAYDVHIANPDAHHDAFVALADAVGGGATPALDNRVTIGRGSGTTTAASGSQLLVNLTLATPSGLEVASNNLQLADSVAGAGLVISGKVLSVGAGAGLTVAADSVALTLPGTLSVGSTNSASGSHTHAVTSSSNPGAAAALLATDAAGALTIRDHTIGRSLRWGTTGAEDIFLQRSAISTLRLTGDLGATGAAHLLVAGKGVFGDTAGPGVAALDVRDATEQLRLRYDASNYASLAVGGGGSLTLAPTGDLVADPAGNTVRPALSYDVNLGTPQRKWLSLHVAELWADALVAQETIATIGGRILVAPTTTLEADLAAGDDAILVKHNSVSTNDVLYLERDFRVEFMRVTGASQNYVRDASFEDGWVGGLPVRWQTDGTVTLSQQATAPGDVHGARHLRIVATSGALRGVRQDVAGLTPGASYRLSVYVRGAGVAVTIRAYDGGGTSNAVTATATGSGDWQRVALTKVCPAGGSIRVAIQANSGGTLDVDAVLLEDGTTTGAYRTNTADAGGTYRYTVARDLDGTGANDWPAGAAVVSTGQAGQGFIDLYSQHGVTGVRLSAIFNFQSATGTSPFESGTYGPDQSQSTSWELFGRSQAGDGIYFGVTGATWANLYFTLARPFAFTGGSAVWEYWNGSAWTAFSPTATGGLFAVGPLAIEWSTLAGWAPRTINSLSAYWVRWRWVTAPTLTQFGLQGGGRTVYRGRRAFGPGIVMNVRNSTTFNDWSEHAAIGNLSGTYDYAGDTYGVAVGKYSPTTSWLGADAAQGIRIMRGSVRLAQWDTAGDITIGQVAPSQANTFLSAGALQLRVNTTPRIQLSADGTIRQGEDVGTGAGTRLLIVGAAGSYGEAAESLALGDVMLGRNAASQANALWKASEGRLRFRGGTTTQLYIDTDGSLVFAGGQGSLNSLGMRLTVASATVGGASSLSWYSGGTQAAWIQGYINGTTERGLYLYANQAGTATPTRVQILAESSGLDIYRVALNSASNYIELDPQGAGSNRARLLLQGTTVTLNGAAVAIDGTVTAQGGLNLGSGTGASAGTVRGSGAAIIGPSPVTAVSAGALSAGSGTRDWTPTAGTWGTNTTTLLTGNPWASIGFHSQGNRVDFIRGGNGVLHIGYDGGFGATNTQFPGNAAAFGGAPATNQRVRIVSTGDTSSHFPLIIANASQSADLLRVRGDSVFQIAGTWANISDARVKRDVRPLLGALAQVRSWRPVAYRWADGRADGGVHLGFVAQELAAVTPELVRPQDEGHDALLTVNYDEAVPVVAAAVAELERELRAELAVLRAEIAALRGGPA